MKKALGFCLSVGQYSKNWIELDQMSCVGEAKREKKSFENDPDPAMHHRRKNIPETKKRSMHPPMKGNSAEA